MGRLPNLKFFSSPLGLRPCERLPGVLELSRVRVEGLHFPLDAAAMAVRRSIGLHRQPAMDESDLRLLFRHR